MVKTQDMSYSNRLHMVTLDVMRIMIEAGFDIADQFILVGTRASPDRTAAGACRPFSQHLVDWGDPRMRGREGKDNDGPSSAPRTPQYAGGTWAFGYLRRANPERFAAEMLETFGIDVHHIPTRNGTTTGVCPS